MYLKIIDIGRFNQLKNPQVLSFNLKYIFKIALSDRFPAFIDST